MLSSGPRSYYDDYLRKKSTGRVVEDPTALLTDRNAYVNFLEVQLERVSAACLAVQSTEERFTDLTGMIQTLEQRCTANIKLVGLAQQCTEQVRAEFDRKFDILVKQQQDDREEFSRTLRQLTIQITQQERKLEQYVPLQQRMAQCERDISALNDELSSTKEQVLHLQVENSRLQQMLEEEKETRKYSEEQLAQNMNSNQQKLLSLIDDHHLDQSRMYQDSIDRFQDLFNVQQESLIEAQQSHRRFVDSSLQKQTDNIEQIQQDFVTRLNSHYSDLSQEMTLMKENIQEEINTSILHSIESSAELKETIKTAISLTLDPICTEFFSSIDDRISSESQRVLDEYIFLAQNFNDENNDSLVYPSAPEPSIAQSMSPSLFGVSPNRNNKDNDDTRKPPLPFPSELNRINSQRSLKKSLSEKSLGEKSLASSATSYMSEESPSRLINKDKAPAARQELDAIHNTLQSLLSMHREDILSIHHRLDAMQVPLGVAPAKPLSRRNSVMKSIADMGNTSAQSKSLDRQESMRSIDTNISALTIKSFQSTDSSKVSKKSAGSKASKKSGKTVKSKVSEGLEPDDELLTSVSKFPKKNSYKSISQVKSERSLIKKGVENSFASSANKMDRELSFAVSKDSGISSKKSSKKKLDAENSFLDLSDDESDSDYEDTVIPVELSGNMSFISNKSKSFLSRDKSHQSLKAKPSQRSLSSSLTRPTQASLQRHPSSSPQIKDIYGPRSKMSRSNLSDVKLLRRKVPSSSSTGVLSNSSNKHQNVSTIHNEESRARSVESQSRQAWKVNNTFVPSVASAISTSVFATKMSQRRKSAASANGLGDNVHHISCHDCHHHHQFHLGVAHKDPTSSIKETVVSVDGCCRYCGKDMDQSKPSGGSSVSGKKLL